MAEITHTDRLSRLLARQRREAEHRRNAALVILALLTLGMAALGVQMATSLTPLPPASVVSLVFVGVVFLGCVVRAALAEEAVLAIDRTIEAHDAERHDDDGAAAIDRESWRESLQPRRPPYRRPASLSEPVNGFHEELRRRTIEEGGKA